MLGLENGVDITSQEVTGTLAKLKKEWLSAAITAWDKKMAERVKQLEIIHLQLVQAEAELIRDINSFKGAARNNKQQEVILRTRVQELLSLKGKFFVNLKETEKSQANPFEARVKEIHKYEAAKDRMIQEGTYVGRDALIMEEMILKERSKVKPNETSELSGKPGGISSDGKKAVNNQAVSPATNAKPTKGAAAPAGKMANLGAVGSIQPEISLSKIGQTSRDPTPIPISVKSSDNQDALAELQAELEKKEAEAERLIQSIEKQNTVLKNRRDQHAEFLKARDSEKNTVMLARANREIEKLKREQTKVLDVEVLRKSYYNSILHSYDIERTILADQQERIKQQNELENKYRQMEIESATNRAKMQEMSQRVETVLKATQQGLANRQLEMQLEDIKRQSDLKKDVMLAEAALKFDFIKDKREVAVLKKRLLEKYQLGQGTNLEKALKSKRRYLEDDAFGRNDDYAEEADSEGQGGTYLTRLAKEGAQKLKDIDYSLSEEDSAISAQEPAFSIPTGLTKAKMNTPNPSKTFVVRLVAAENLPGNVGVVKAELKVVGVGHKSLVAPVGVLPLFDAELANPRFDAQVSHSFDGAPGACYVIVRFVTIDLADFTQSAPECSVVGFAIMPVYCDAETDEPANKHTRNVYLKRGHFRVPLIMEEYVKADFSYSNLMKLPKYPGSEVYFSIGESEKDVDAGLPGSLDKFQFVEKKDSYLNQTIRTELRSRTFQSVREQAISYLNAAIEGGMNPITSANQKPTDGQLSDFLLDLMSEVPEECNWLDSRFYFPCDPSDGFFVDVNAVVYPEASLPIVTIAHLIPPGGLYSLSGSTTAYGIFCEHQDTKDSIWLQKYARNSKLLKSPDLSLRTFLVLEMREILTAPVENTKKTPASDVIRIAGGKLGFKTLGYSVIGLVDEDTSTLADGVYQLPIIKGTLDLELFVEEQQLISSAVRVSKKIQEDSYRANALVPHASVIFSVRNTIYDKNSFKKIDQRRMVKDVNPQYVWDNIMLSKISEWNPNYSPISNSIVGEFAGENLAYFYKTIKEELVQSVQD